MHTTLKLERGYWRYWLRKRERNRERKQNCIILISHYRSKYSIENMKEEKRRDGGGVNLLDMPTCSP
uniref:Uncharacterized protein n=1 Tax=Cannabis sativa TaxID=3483 RepID=A0A803QVX2_CANSA